MILILAYCGTPHEFFIFLTYQGPKNNYYNSKIMEGIPVIT